MVLERDDHRVVGGEERSFFDGGGDFAERHFSAHGLAVRHDRKLVLPVPAVDLNAPTIRGTVRLWHN